MSTYVKTGTEVLSDGRQMNHEPLPAQGPVDVTVGPLAWAVFADNGNIRIWSSASDPVRKLAEENGMRLIPLGDISLLRALIADDGYAMTFQSVGQYRAALLKALTPNADLCGGPSGPSERAPALVENFDLDL